MKRILLLLFITVFFSCKDKNKTDIDTMVATIKKHIEDYNFKRNQSLNLLEFEYLKCDTINENDFALSKRNIFLEQIRSFLKLKLEYTKMSNDNLKQMYLYKSEGFTDLYSIANDSLIKNKEKIKELTDSVVFYTKKDSLLNLSIQKNTKPKPVYKINVFIKGIAKFKSGETSNVLDTFYYFFDNDLKLLKK